MQIYREKWTLILVIAGHILTCTANNRIQIRLDKCRGINDTKISLNQLVISDKDEGNFWGIYVAGTNCLYQLRSDLKVEHLVITGPQEDSVLCSARGSCQQGAGDDKTLTDNHAKALVLDNVDGTLIACGSLFQGICDRFVADDISQKLGSVAVPLVANDMVSKSVIFIGPGLPDARSHRVLYVASPHTHKGPYRSQEEIPIISRSVFLFPLDSTILSNCAIQKLINHNS